MQLPAEESACLRVGEFEVDLRCGELRRNGDNVKLQQRPFQVLAVLVQRPGEVVTREEIRQNLWPTDTFVDFEHSINTAVTKLREALGDQAEDPRFIETLPRYGYRLIAPVEIVSTNGARPTVESPAAPSPPESPAPGAPFKPGFGLRGTPKRGYRFVAPVSRAEDYPDASGEMAAREEGVAREQAAPVPGGNVWKLVLAAAALLVVLAAAWSSRRFTQRVPFQDPEITQLTAEGNEHLAAISPDGRYVAYVSLRGGDGKQSLWIKQISGGGQVQIVPPGDVFYGGLTFSRNGDFIYAQLFGTQVPGLGLLQRIPVLGGLPQTVLTDIDSPVTLSPDGKHLAFVRDTEADISMVMVASDDGSGERTIATHKLGDPFEDCAWSPDGKTISMSSFNTEAGSWTLLEVPAAGGTERAISQHRWRYQPSGPTHGLAWISNGRGLIAGAIDWENTSPQIEYVSYPEGEVHKITNDLNAYFGVSLSADSHLLTTHQANWSSDIWLLNLAEPDGVRPITTGGRSSGPAWTPDRRILYISAETKTRNFWVMDSNGNGSRPVTNNKEGIRVNAPHVPSNGHYMVFRSDRAGSFFHVWREDLDGNNPKQLSDAPDEFVSGLDVSPDGKWVVYSRIDRSGPGLWKIPIDGGSPVRLTEHGDFPVVSPEGNSIAYFYNDPKTRYGSVVAVMPFEGGPPTRLFDIPSDLYRWTPDARSLLYVKDEGFVSNFWSQEIAGGPPKQMTHFSNGSGSIGSFDVSKDGKQLVIERYSNSNHIVLIRDLK